MVRNGTKLHKVQQKIFREAHSAEGYLNAMTGVLWSNDDTMLKADSIYNTLACIIFEMGWDGDYQRYKTENTAEAVPSAENSH